MNLNVLISSPARLRAPTGRAATTARSQTEDSAESVTSKQADILGKLRRGDAANGASSRRNLLTSTAAGIAGGCMCGICGDVPARAAAPGDWGYTPKQIVIQQDGAYAWGSTCAVGGAQSPVDLPFSKQPCSTKDIREIPAQRITTRFRMTDKCCITNGGHGTMQVNFPEGSCGSVIGSKKLELLQFHFHTPSEHALNNKRYAMEAHLVHREIGTDNLTVLGVMIQRSKGAASNPALRKALDLAPAAGGKVCNEKTNFNPVDLLPGTFLEGRRSYLNYRGSLTTPPCTEGVNWYVYTDPIAVADEDIFDFIEWCGNGTVAFNSRPLYPLNDREWTLYKEG